MFTKLFVVGSLILFAPSSGSAINKYYALPDVSAEEIVDRVNEILALADTSSEQVMTVVRRDGTTRQYTLRVMTSGVDKAFAEIVEPSIVKGRQFLRSGDTVWAYFPDSSILPVRSVRRSKIAIRVSGRDTFMGGDFSNNDVLRLNLIGDYAPEIIQELPDLYVLKLEGKDLKLSYAQLRMWVRKTDFQPVRLEIYSVSQELIKSIFYRDYRDFDGVRRPAVLEVKSAILPDSKTVLEIVDLQRGVETPPNRFQRSSLGR
jgi:outer membrane lipoprotein-sorting protein